MNTGSQKQGRNLILLGPGQDNTEANYVLQCGVSNPNQGSNFLGQSCNSVDSEPSLRIYTFRFQITRFFWVSFLMLPRLGGSLGIPVTHHKAPWRGPSSTLSQWPLPFILDSELLQVQALPLCPQGLVHGGYSINTCLVTIRVVE